MIKQECMIVRGCLIACAAPVLSLLPCGSTIADDFAELGGFEVVTGISAEGGLEELDFSDDAYLQTQSGFGRSLADVHHMEMHLRFHSCITEPDYLNVHLESFIEGERGIGQLRLWNWDRGAFDQIASFTIGSVEESRSVTGILPHPYLNADGETVMSIKHIVIVPFLAFQFHSFIDNVELEMIAPELEVDFAFPMDGRDHLLVGDLQRLCHRSFIIDASPDMSVPFQVLPIDEQGEAVEGMAMTVHPGTTCAYNIPWATAYMARTLDVGDIASGQMRNARRRIERSSWADRQCASEWIEILRGGEEGKYNIKVWGESDPDGDGVFTASQCLLEVRETLLDALGNVVLDDQGNPVHQETGFVDPGDDGSVHIYRFKQAWEDAGYQIVFEVRCLGDAERVCRISVKINDNPG